MLTLTTGRPGDGMQFDAVDLAAPLLSCLTDQEHRFADALLDLGLSQSDVRFAVAMAMDAEA